VSRGRKAKPFELKVLEGNPGHRPLEASNHPSPPRKVPTCPKWLVGEARREWARLAPELFRSGLLTELDRGTLVHACSAWGRSVAAEMRLAQLETERTQLKDRLAETPEDTAAAETLEKKLNKNWGEICTETGKRKNAVAEHMKLTACLGMNPSARSSIKVSNGQGELDLGQPTNAFDTVMRQSSGA
jgi:P27 family predicted phage terminase small subunit